MVCKFILFIGFLLHVCALHAGDVELIRAFDLGGQGLKTALLRYDKNTGRMDWVEVQARLGRCPDTMEIEEWVRLRMREVLGKDLDDEINAGHLFGFSLAGLEKLRSKALPHCDMSVLFRLPADKVRCIDDGASHLVASLNTLDLEAYDGPIWNFSLGTGVGWGFTDDEHKVRNFSDFWTFFGTAPWLVKYPHTETEVWIPCGSRYGFDQIVDDHEGIVDESAFAEFALRWKCYIEECVLVIGRTKKWGSPVAIVFTGGHIDTYGDRLVNTLKELHSSIPLFAGPQNAGLLGAAWNTVKKPFGQTMLIRMIGSLNTDAVTALIAEGTNVNERDALGNSPLSAAIKAGDLEIIKQLVENGALINDCDFSGQTPLCLAVRSGNLGITTFLLEHGAEVNRADYWNQSPLSFAAEDKKIQSLLLEYGALY